MGFKKTGTRGRSAARAAASPELSNKTVNPASKLPTEVVAIPAVIKEGFKVFARR